VISLYLKTFHKGYFSSGPHERATDNSPPKALTDH
jgi:hypothetical protein